MFFPLVMGALVGAFLTFFIFLAIFSVDPNMSQLISPTIISVLKDVGGPVAAGFGGAIAGALCSYVFQRKIEREKEFKADVSAIHKTSVHFMMQLNDLFTIKKNGIYPSVTDPARFLNMSKIPSNPNVSDRIDPRIIDIAMSVNDAAAIDILYLADSMYRACFENIINRNSCIDEFRADVVSSGLGRKGEHSIRDLVDTLGEGQLISLYLMTEQMIDVLDESLGLLHKAMGLVNELVDKKYKGLEVLRLKLEIDENKEYLSKTPPPYFDVDSLREFLNRENKT